MTPSDAEQLAQESALWPWLDSDCMADEPPGSMPLGYQEPCPWDWDATGWGANPDR